MVLSHIEDAGLDQRPARHEERSASSIPLRVIRVIDSLMPAPRPSWPAVRGKEALAPSPTLLPQRQRRDRDPVLLRSSTPCDRVSDSEGQCCGPGIPTGRSRHLYDRGPEPRTASLS